MTISLRKIPLFHLIFWYEHFAEMHSFHSVLGELPETLQKCAFPQNFHIKKLGKISIFYAIICYGENGTFVFLPIQKMICNQPNFSET